MKIFIEGEKTLATFRRRLNRFVAEIEIDGKVHLSHVPNTGRMAELLVPGAKVIVRRIDGPLRKTSFDLLFVYYKKLLVAIDSKLPNQLLRVAFENKEIPYFKAYDQIKREVNYRKSRFDFSLNNLTENVLIEAKCVTLVKEGGIASFPDAPTERGTRHVLELIQGVQEGIRGAVIFIIQRSDATCFTPNQAMDPLFADAVKRASAAGIEFYAYSCTVTENYVSIDRELEIII